MHTEDKPLLAAVVVVMILWREFVPITHSIGIIQWHTSRTLSPSYSPCV